MTVPERAGSRYARRLIALAVTLAILGSAGGAGPVDVLAAPVVTFDVPIGDCSLSGTGPASSSFDVEVRDADGVLKGETEVVTSTLGRWGAPCFLAEGQRFMLGDRIAARQDATLLRSYTVPTFTLRTARVSDRVFGTAPPGTRVVVKVRLCRPQPANCFLQLTRQRPVEQDGTWTTDLTNGQPDSYDAIGVDLVVATLLGVSGDTVDRMLSFPYLEVAAGNAVVTGVASAGRVARFTLRGPKGVVRATATAIPVQPFGSFTATFRRDGERVKVAIGDTVSASIAADATIRVRATTIGVDDPHEGDVTGRCIPHGRFSIRAVDPEGANEVVGGGVADANGRFATAGFFPPEPGWTLQLRCASLKGDVIRKTRLWP
jgi:hypothetical protein